MGVRIHDVHKTVEEVLIQYPDTRNSDDLLYLMVCKCKSPSYAKLPLERALLERKNYGIPTYASVDRARRKVQAENPELRGSDSVTDARYENYKEYKEYALEG